jgi:ABC-type protease/lipase transport system fused ATPase/permease subunit
VFAITQSTYILSVADKVLLLVNGICEAYGLRRELLSRLQARQPPVSAVTIRHPYGGTIAEYPISRCKRSY